MALGPRLREAREARDTSLDVLAAAMHITPEKLRRAESGCERLSGAEIYGAILQLHLPMDLLFAPRNRVHGSA